MLIWSSFWRLLVPKSRPGRENVIFEKRLFSLLKAMFLRVRGPLGGTKSKNLRTQSRFVITFSVVGFGARFLSPFRRFLDHFGGHLGGFWAPKRRPKRVGTEKGQNAIRVRLLAFAHTFKGPGEPFRRPKRSLGAAFFTIVFGIGFGSVFMLIYVDLGAILGTFWEAFGSRTIQKSTPIPSLFFGWLKIGLPGLIWDTGAPDPSPGHHK